jgi:hypothetical protein
LRRGGLKNYVSICCSSVYLKLGIVAYALKPSTPEAEAEGSLHSDFLTQKKNNKKNYLIEILLHIWNDIKGYLPQQCLKSQIVGNNLNVDQYRNNYFKTIPYNMPLEKKQSLT